MPHILELIENLSADIDMHFALMFNPDKREMVHEIYDTMFEQRKSFYFTMNVVTIRQGDRVDPRYTPEDFAWQKQAIKEFNDLAKSVSAQFPARKKEKYSNPIIRTIEDNGEIKDVKPGNRTVELAEGLLRFKGMYCIAHASVLRIEEDGRCRGMICSDDKYIGNIFEENFFMKVRDKLIHAVKCTHNICGCGANDPIPKFVSEEESKKYVEFAQKRQAQLFDEYAAAQQVKSSNLQYVTSTDIMGISEEALEKCFGAADVVRKITEYEYISGDNKSKVVYKAENGIITEIICLHK